MTEPDFTVALRIFGKWINPPDICMALGMQARWSHKAGDVRVDPKGNMLGGIYDEGYCSIDIVRLNSEALSHLIKRQAEKLEKHKNLFLDIKTNNGRSEFFVGWFGAGNFGDVFQSSTLKILGELGIDLSVDIYGALESKVRHHLGPTSESG